MRSLLFVLFIAIGSGLQAQFNQILQTPTSKDRFVIHFTNNGWMNTENGVDAGVSFRPNSLGFAAYVMNDYDFGESAFSFAWGYGFSSHNIHSDGEFVREVYDHHEETVFLPLNNPSLKKNKLSCNYLEVPIEFRLRTGKDGERANWKFKAEKENRGPQFNMAIGARIGYAVNIHTKTIDDQGMRKAFGIEDFNHLRYGLTARIGFGSLGIVGFYSLSPLINNNRIPATITPYSIGIAYLIL